MEFVLNRKSKLINGSQKSRKLGLVGVFAFLLTYTLGTITVFPQIKTEIINQDTEPKRLNSPYEVSNLKEWKRFNLAEGNISILFPDSPGRISNSKSLPQGFTSQYRYYWDTSDEQLYFEAQILKLSPDKSFNLEQGVQGFKQQMKNRNAVLLNEKKIEVNGISAFDLSYQVPDKPEPILNYSRVILCGNQIYTLMVAGTKNQKDLFNVSDKYFDSFSPTIECKTPESSTVESKQSQIETRTSTPLRTYIRGPKGGCYYINDKRNKVYVDKSLCR